TSPTYIYTLSLHDALPICYDGLLRIQPKIFNEVYRSRTTFYQKRPFIVSVGNNQLLIFGASGPQYYKNSHIINLKLPSSYNNFKDRKSTRLNSSHSQYRMP